MPGVAIVALPAEDEKVNKISSEKKAHLTLLFLGETELSADAILYIQHAASQLSPVYMNSDYRGPLGPDEADVLFLEKNGWDDYRRISEFRHHLLLNDEIRRAYDSIPQYSEWTPHVTLGYPESPANVDPEDDPPRFFGMHFDRIAVWVEDSDGPEFRLRYEDHSMEVAMSSMTTAERGAHAADEIFHYGVKGMKWGVTNVDRSSSPQVLQDVPGKKGATAVTVSQRKSGTLVKTKGGERHKATDDAVKAAAARQKAKKSTTDALTNDELKAAVERMNLEQQYVKLAKKTDRRSAGQRFVESLLGIHREIADATKKNKN